MKEYILCLISYFLPFLVSLGYGKADAEIPCRVVQVVAETDPVNRNLKPAFHYVYECRGGLSLRKGLQCQAVKTDRKRLKVLNVYRGKEEVRYVETAVTCQEKCVCRGRCKNPKTGHCNNGLRYFHSVNIAESLNACHFLHSENFLAELQLEENSISLNYTAMKEICLLILWCVVRAPHRA